ncbi:MAG TPA: type I restriction enzyme endonuclease domain-containing protein, partial [Vicinamibacterales bacterium]|nr:type I restriction enzyme endonuclease domain-containing protein [Vicinamibacterales bacterium]
RRISTTLFARSFHAPSLVIRRRKNVVQARSFAEMLEQTIRRYQNRAIEAAQVIEERIGLAKEMREANARGEALGHRPSLNRPRCFRAIGR